MNNYTFSVVLLAVLVLVINQAEAARKTKEELAVMTCKQAQSYLTKEVMMSLGKCTKKLKFKSQKERQEKMNCVFKCVMIEEGILISDGMATPEQIEAFVKEQSPEKFLPRILPLVSKCVNDPNIKLDPTEEFCKSYEPPIKCLMEQVPTFCEQNPDL